MKMKFFVKNSGVLLGLFTSLLINASVQAAQVEQTYTTVYRYDLSGRVTGAISPDPDAGGSLRLQATRNTYDTTTGLLIKVEKGELANWADENTPVTSWTGFTVFSIQSIMYDGYGRKSIVITKDKNGTPLGLTQTNYDSNNRVKCVAVRMNKASFSSPTSLPDACVLSADGSDGPDRISQYTYNDYDQVKTETRAVGVPSLTQTYVTNEFAGRRLASQTDANGNRTELRYDTSLRLTRMVYPDPAIRYKVNEGDYVEFSNFDANGNAKTERKRNGALINYTFDNNQRVIVKDYVDNTKQRDVHYDYDLRGLETLESFGSAATSDRTAQKYDGFGNLITDFIYMGGVGRAIYSQYDSNNNRIRVTHTDTGTYFTYGFDGLNRMQVIYEGGGTRMLEMNYGPDGRRQRIYRRSGVSTTNYAFSNGVQLSSINQDFPNNSYDLTNSFQYTVSGQISQLTLGNSLYYYRGNDNRTGNYTVNGLNQYTYVGGVTQGSGQPMAYDANANLINDGTLTYQYDDENRLISTNGSVVSSFTYDPRGRLFQTIINGTKTQYLYDGDALVAEYDTNGTLQRRYVHGDRVDEPLVQYNSSALGTTNWRYLHADHQGSIIAQSDVNGNVLSTLSYDSYGIPATGNTDRFGYTGQIWFKELGLFYYKARMYHPKLGRFMQIDPIGYSDSMNLYGYTGNDPLNNTDPSGMDNCVVTNPDGTTTPIPDCKGDKNADPESQDEKAKRDKVDEVVVTGTRSNSGPNLQVAVDSPGEVGFKVDKGNLKPVELSKTEVLNCSNGEQVEKHTINRADISGAEAIGHTHGTDIVSGIGPDDVSTAMATGMPAYVAYGSGVSVVEKVGGSYRARLVTGSWGAARGSGVKRQINKANKGGNGKDTQSKGCK